MSNATFIFQDYTDADNFVSVSDILRNIPPDGRIVVLVVIGRRADLSYASVAGPPGWLTEQLEEDSDEVSCDSQMCYLDGARRMRGFLETMGVLSKVTHFVVDGTMFIPTAQSPLSHAAHVHDYLFDRGDIFGREVGDVITPSEYVEIVSRLRDDPHRRTTSRAILTSAGTTKTSDVFINFASMDMNNFASVDMYLLAPLTGATAVLESVLRRAPDSVRIFGQLFAYHNLSPESKNLTLNQFNVDADPAASIAFLEAVVKGGERNAKCFCFPTEVAKFNARQKFLEMAAMTEYLKMSEGEKKCYPVMRLWELYCAAKKKAPLEVGVVPDMLYDLTVTMFPLHENFETFFEPVTVSHSLISEMSSSRLLNTSSMHPSYLRGRVGFEMRRSNNEGDDGTMLYAMREQEFGWCTEKWQERFTTLLMHRKV